jgi:hypothetical protein
MKTYKMSRKFIIFFSSSNFSNLVWLAMQTIISGYDKNIAFLIIIIIIIIMKRNKNKTE